MGNDDGFGSGNLRELYKLLVDAGHEGKLGTTLPFFKTSYGLPTNLEPVY
jgi:hypothetical protein